MPLHILFTLLLSLSILPVGADCPLLGFAVGLFDLHAYAVIGLFALIAAILPLAARDVGLGDLLRQRRCALWGF